MIRTFAKNKSYFTTFLIILGMFFGAYKTVFAADPVGTLGFQGQLYSSGAPVTSSVNATFTFYDAITGGAVTGSPITKTITVANGYFGTQFSEADTVGVDFNQKLFIEVVINGTPLTPRTSVNATVSSLKTFGAFSYAVAPAVGPAGSLYFNSTSNTLFVSTGGAWVATGGDASSTVPFSETVTGLDYSTSTGVLSVAPGYTIPLTASTTEWANKVSSQWSNSGADIYFNTGNVGVGTTDANVDPGETGSSSIKMQINGGALGIFNVTNGTPRNQLTISSIGSNFAHFYSDGNSLNNSLSIGGSNSLIGVPTNPIMTWQLASQKVGVGTAIPLQKFSVVNNGYSGGFYSADTNNSGILIFTPTGQAQKIITDFNGTTPEQALILGTWTNKDDQLVLSTSGNVGVGTTTPSEALSVVGAVNTTLGYKLNGYTIVNAGINTGSTQLGVLAGTAFNATTTFNTAVGYLALNSTNGAAGDGTSGNTAVGALALQNNTSGYLNNALGYLSLSANTTGYRNNAFGYASLNKNTTGINNSAFGDNALLNSATSSFNSAFGAGALLSNTAGSNSVAVGNSSSFYNINASGTVAIGRSAAQGSSAYSNQHTTVVGFRSGFSLANGSDQNTFLGFQSGFANTSGANNIFLGSQAGDNITTGSNNIVLGFNVDAPSASASNQLNIGNLIFGNGIDGTGTTLSSGNIGIGTTTATDKLTIAGALNLTGAFKTNGNTGTLGQLLQTTATGTQWVSTSSLGISGGSGTVNSGTSGQIAFYNANGTAVSGTSTISLVSGRLGIGANVSSPEKMVEIQQAANAAEAILLRLRNPTTGTGTGVAIDFINTTGTGNDTFSGGKISVIRQTDASNDMLFHANSNAGSLPEIFRLKGNTGFLGLGTTTPGSKLSVVGDLNLTGAFRANGNSGTAGMVLQTTGTGTQWVATSSLGIAGGAGTNYFTLVNGGVQTSTSTDYFRSAYFVASSTTGTSTFAGSVAIGSAASPFTKLDITTQSTTSLTYGLSISNAGAIGAATGILFATNGGSTGAYSKGALVYERTGTFGEGDFKFLQNAVADGTNATLAQTVMTIKSNGNVGIGTTTPSVKLSLGSGSFNMLGNNGRFFTIAPSLNGTINGTDISVGRTGDLRIGTNDPGGDVFAGAGLQMFSNSNATYSGQMYFDSGTSTNAALIFRTGTSGPTERLRILGNGNVGIGTSAPGAKLTIEGSSATGDLVVTNTSAAGSISLASLLAPSATGDTYFSVGKSLTAGNAALIGLSNVGSATNYAFLTTFGRPASDFVVASTGNIGVGTTTPLAKLSVVGSTGSTADIFTVSSSTGTRYITVTTGGAFLIGATSSLYKFAIEDSINNAYFSVNGSNAVNGDAGFRLQQGGVDKWSIFHDGGSSVFQNAGALLFYDNVNNQTRLTLDDNGNVGIGTIAPGSALQVSGTVNNTPTTQGVHSGMFSGFASQQFYGSSGSFIDFIDGSGEDADFRMLHSAGVFRIGAGTGPSGIAIDSSGNIGIGTTTPSATFTASGTIRFINLGSGGANLITDSLGNVTVSSDERLKDIQGDFVSGLDKIKGITPITYRWKTETGYDTVATYAGFSAQNVQANIPEAVTTDSRGFLTLADRPILAALVNAVKEIGAWFVDGKLKIQNDVCVDDVCLTKEEFKQMIIRSKGQVSGSVQVPPPTNNPAPTPAPSNEEGGDEPEPESEPEPEPDPAPAIETPAPVVETPAPAPAPTPAE